MIEHVRPWHGYVTLEARDAAGELLERRVVENAYTNGAAVAYASRLAGGTPSLTLTHMDVGTGGAMISAADSASGWSGSPTADTSIYKEGTGALKGTAVAPGTATFYHATSVGGTANLGGTSVIDAWLRVESRAAINLTTSELRLYSYGGTANYKAMTLANVETAGTVTLADLTWTRVTLATSATEWTTAGTAVWTNITGLGIKLVAASGTATIRWDQVVGITTYPESARVGWTATPGSRGIKALTTGPSQSGGTVTAGVAYIEAEVVGDFNWVGLYSASGATLVAVAPLTYYKAYGVVLTLTWTVVVAGG